MLTTSGDGSVEGSSSGRDAVELRPRTQRSGSGPRLSKSEEGRSNQKVIIEKKVKPGDSLNKIALQYSVDISELKRTNNIVKEQDLYALPVVRIPISRFRKELNLEHERDLLRDDSPDESDAADDKPLLSDGSLSRSVDKLFEKTDQSIAQVRETIPNVEGAFHFVDANSPDQSHKGLWITIVIVIVMFLIVPLVLTFFEEKSEIFDERDGVSSHLVRRKSVLDS
ncbi:unnamed protein product [Anisakis simplex]|uniref:LysM domain-containing protein n=1 Tax=Anisakis simplex TaxID=6269 RepID=A0A0M3KDC0_ANISI|nr:unnamed protein product [Anisakis simplex]